MKVLVISDLHANWPALEAVLNAESYDALIVCGDLVSYGPYPGEVVDFVRTHATPWRFGGTTTMPWPLARIAAARRRAARWPCRPWAAT